MRLLSLVALLASASAVSAQQVPDGAFTFQNEHPAFSLGSGPMVCVDARADLIAPVRSVPLLRSLAD